MRVLVACEFSGRVRDCFAHLGHDTWSCDLLPSEREGNHLQCDVREVLDQNWDLMIAHPPCTHLAVSGARWWGEKRQEQADAIEFAMALWAAPINKIVIENPVGILTMHLGEWSQMVHPYYFGDNEYKATCLWVKGLPPLHATHGASPRLGLRESVHREPPGPDRWKNRSRTPIGMAAAMALQWGVEEQQIDRGLMAFLNRPQPFVKRRRVA